MLSAHTFSIIMKDLFPVKFSVRMKDRKGQIMQVFSDVHSMEVCISVSNARKENILRCN